MNILELSELADVTYGYAFDSERFSDDGDIPLIRIRDVVRGYSTTYYSGDYDARYLVRAGDLLVGMDGEFNRGRWDGGEALLNQRVCKIEVRDERLHEGYLYWFLPESLKEIERQTSFVTVKHLSAKTINALPIPLPPIEEQRRIASILDAADALRSKRRQALEKLETLTQSIFVDMFGDPLSACPIGSEPTEWVRLGEIAKVTTGKLDANAASVDGLFPFFTCANEPLRINKSAFNEKAVLVAGNCDLNVKYYEGEFNAYQRTYVITSSNESLVHPRFLYGFLEIYVKMLRSQAIGGVIKYIKLGNLMDAQVNLPSVEAQERFVRKISQKDSMKASTEHSLRMLTELWGVLQQRAFRGEL